MSEARFTPGPWIAAASPSSIVGWPICANTGRVICSINYVQHTKIDPKVPGDRAFNAESAANARLIAAAPDMYEALKALVGPSKGAPDGRAVMMAHAALAKAEGSAPHPPA